MWSDYRSQQTSPVSSSGITEEPLTLTFIKLGLREAYVRLEGYCLYVKAINKFYWEGQIYVCSSLCVWMFVCAWVWRIVCVRDIKTSYWCSLLWNNFHQQVLSSQLLSRYCIYETAIKSMRSFVLVFLKRQRFIYLCNLKRKGWSFAHTL